MSDSVVPFVFEHRNVRGTWLEIETGVAEMLGHRNYSPDVRQLVAEACAAAPLLAASIQFDGRLSLQFQAPSDAGPLPAPLKLLLAQADAALNTRGMAKADAQAAGTLQQLMAGGVLGLLLEGQGKAPNYQALVEIRGETLAAALEGYFAQSEQLPTRLCLASTSERLAGLLIQRLPARVSDDDDGHWAHLGALFNTLSTIELAENPIETLLPKLFPGEDIRVFEARPVRLACHCDHASISALLLSLGRDEIVPLVQERGVVEVTCEFCGKAYQHSVQQIHDLFAAAAEPAGERPRH